MQGQLVISPDVMKALRENTAVVALESTIISHGMPYPQVRKGLSVCLAIAATPIKSQQGNIAALIAAWPHPVLDLRRQSNSDPEAAHVSLPSGKRSRTGHTVAKIYHETIMCVANVRAMC